jgi:membrane-bound serine protease (ClpP class)
MSSSQAATPMKRLFALLIAALLGWLVATAGPAQTAPSRSAVVLTIDGAIGPATAAHIERGLKLTAERGAAAVVLRIDTPGGLDTSMREIIRALLASPVPVLSFVGPSGSRAASAGTYILYASHVAGMAPGTNLGAATPVSLGGGMPFGAPKPPQQPASGASGTERGSPAGRDPSEAKALNDAVAYIRSLADMRGRDADWAEAAVREAASLPAREALARGVIDVVAEDIPDLLKQAHGRTVQVATGRMVLQTEGLALQPLDADWRTRVIGVITNPNVAMLLMMLGIYGLLFEFMSPGALVPGVVGAISLLLGLYALSVLPLNYAGVALLLLGAALLVAEAFSPSFGILGLGGAVAFVFGAGLLVDTETPGFAVSTPLMAGLAVSALMLSGLVARLAWRTRRLRSASGRDAMLGQAVPVLDWSGDAGHVLIAGERWRATGASGLVAGQTARVQAVRGLTVQVAAVEMPHPPPSGEPR